MTLFHRVAESFRARQQKKAGDFLELVRQVTADKGPEPAEVAEALDRFGQTLEAFEEAVRHQQQRNEWAAQRAQIPELKRQAAEITAEIRTDAAEWEALTKAHEEKIVPLFIRLRGLDSELNKCQGLDKKLAQSYRGPLTADLEKLRAERGPIHTQLVHTTNQRDQRNKAFASVPDGACYSPETKERNRKIIDAYETEIADLQQRLDALNAREREIEAEMLNP